MLLFAALPFVAFLGVWLLIGNLSPGTQWRRAFLRAALLWGAYAVALTEALSILRAIQPGPLIAGWGVVVLASAGWLGLRAKGGIDVALPSPSIPSEWPSRLALILVTVVVGLTALIAWLAPPNTWDSLNYHMSRVAHWAQERAVLHFATGIEIQNHMPPGAEMLILNSYVLAGGDRLANLVQWFAMVGSLIGVSLLAGQLGAARPGQWLAVAYAATLPMGIIQASSTMTDYLVGIWVLAAAIEALAVWRDRLPVTQASLYFGLAAGLGALTKPTGYAYIAPLAALAILGLWRQYGGWQAARALVLIGLVSLSLNFGQFLRNFLTYDNVLGPSSRIEQHGNQILGGRGLISNLIRNAGLHAGTPSPHVNKALTLSVMKVHELMGLDLNDPRTTAVGQFRIRKPTTNEDWAGNPLHAWLAVPVLGLVFTRRRDRLLSIFTGAVLLTFVLFSLTFKWQVFGSRLHLPFFLLLSPIVGSVAESLNRPKLAVGLVGVLSLASLPWLVGTDPRPLLPIGDQGSLGSVLTTPRRRLYFANASYLEVPYTEMAAQIRNSGCIDVALSLTGGTVEYPLWVLLGAPDQDLRIEWIVSGTDSEKHRDLQFQPCAVICQYCQGQAPYGDLLQTYERGEFRVYQGAYSGE